LDVIDNSILSAIYIGKITGKEPVEIVKKRSGLSEDYIHSKIKVLQENQLLTKEKELTDLGRQSLRVVLTGGVFDIIHPGHIHTLNNAKKLGDVLVVVVATDKTAVKMKKRTPLHNQKQRQILVEALSIVDLCVIGHETDLFKTVEMIKPQIIALGYDQIHQEKFIKDGCKRINLNVKVARLQSPVPEISSSNIERDYGDDIHSI